MRNFLSLSRSPQALNKLEAFISAADDDTLKALVDKHSIRKTGIDIAALILKLLPLERSNQLLKDLPRRQIKEAITRLKDDTPMSDVMAKNLLGDLRQGASALASESFSQAISDAEERTPFVIRALDLAGRFFGNRG